MRKKQERLSRLRLLKYDDEYKDLLKQKDSEDETKQEVKGEVFFDSQIVEAAKKLGISPDLYLKTVNLEEKKTENDH